jgi:hypothetical protein
MKKTFKEFLNYDKPPISEAEITIEKYKVFDRKKGLNIQTGLSLQSAKALRNRLITSGNRSSTEIVIRKESR